MHFIVLCLDANSSEKKPRQSQGETNGRFVSLAVALPALMPQLRITQPQGHSHESSTKLTILYSKITPQCSRALYTP